MNPITADLQKQPKLSFAHIEETDPKIVKLFSIASSFYDVFEAQLRTIGMTPASGRENVAKLRWTMYIGSLFGENFLASIHLAVLQMPRAQVNLNRQLFEYMIRNQWLLRHPGDAADLLDILPWDAYDEVTRAKDAFDSAYVASVENQYEIWKSKSPLANLKSRKQQPSVQSIVNELTQDNPTKEFFFNYSIPSMVAHAKGLGITDVLRITETGQMVREPNSIGFPRLNTLIWAISLILQYGILLAGHFGLDMAGFRELEAKFQDALKELGIEPESIAVRFRAAPL